MTPAFLTLLLTTVADGADPIAALKKAVDWDSYGFTIQEQPGAGTGGMLEARYQKDRPLYCKADRIEFFKKANAIVYLDGERWQRSKTGTTSDPLRVLGAVAKVNAARLPHEEVATLVKVFADAKLKPEKDGQAFKFEFAAEAARSLSRSEYRGVAQSGIARIWLDDDGKLQKYAISIKVQGRIGNAEIDGTVEKTVTISGVGKTKVEVPEPAAKALE